MAVLLPVRPVEVALPVYVAHDLDADAGLLGVCWTSFGLGALAATVITGTLRARNLRRATLLIVGGWGACQTAGDSARGTFGSHLPAERRSCGRK